MRELKLQITDGRINDIFMRITHCRLLWPNIALKVEMSVPEYQDHGPIQVNPDINLEKIAGKSVIITGGETNWLLIKETTDIVQGQWDSEKHMLKFSLKPGKLS
jgi:hypothetical protein